MHRIQHYFLQQTISFKTTEQHIAIKQLFVQQKIKLKDKQTNTNHFKCV